MVKPVIINIKLVEPTAIAPKKAHDDDAGYDCFINSFNDIQKKDVLDPTSKNSLIPLKRDKYTLHPHKRVVCGLGFNMEISNKYLLSIRPRSGLATFEGLSIANTPGTIDP